MDYKVLIEKNLLEVKIVYDGKWNEFYIGMDEFLKSDDHKKMITDAIKLKSEEILNELVEGSIKRKNEQS